MTFQLITFQVNGRPLGIEITSVREIRAWSPAAPLLNAAPYVTGVINLRGAMVAVFDLRQRIGWGETEPTERHVIIVAQAGEQLYGLVVDGVSDILTIDEADTRPVPKVDGDAAVRFVRCLATVEDSIVMVLELDRVLTEASTEIVGELHAEPAPLSGACA
jgi:purine-binding chemotaxis protein CheW